MPALPAKARPDLAGIRVAGAVAGTLVLLLALLAIVRPEMMGMGGWCPYCSATLEALETVLPELSRAGGTLVAMTPETGGRALAMKRGHGLHYEVLVDVDLAIAMAFGVVFRPPPLHAALLRRRGVNLAGRNGNPAWLLPVPAAFLAGPDGVVRRS